MLRRRTSLLHIVSIACASCVDLAGKALVERSPFSQDPGGKSIDARQAVKPRLLSNAIPEFRRIWKVYVAAFFRRKACEVHSA